MRPYAPVLFVTMHMNIMINEDRITYYGIFVLSLKDYGNLILRSVHSLGIGGSIEKISCKTNVWLLNLAISFC